MTAEDYTNACLHLPLQLQMTMCPLAEITPSILKVSKAYLLIEINILHRNV